MGRDAGAKAAAEAMIANKHAERSIADPLRGHITAADSNSSILYQHTCIVIFWYWMCTLAQINSTICPFLL